MALGTLERFYVNSLFRGAVQRPLELAWLNRLHPFPKGVEVLDIGCGDGRGMVALAKRLAPRGLSGVDLDARQIEAARRTVHRAGLRVALQQADISALPLPANDYDVVTSFGAIHHVPDWRSGLGEVARVLRHGGLFYALEFYRPLLEFPLFRWLLPHPAGRFSHSEFVGALEQGGFVVLAKRNLLGLAGLVVARRVVKAAAYD